MLEKDILSFIEQDYGKIEDDMNARNSTSKNKQADNKTRKKREELSVSASKSIKKESLKTDLVFT